MGYESYLEWRKKKRLKELAEEKSSSNPLMRSDSSLVFNNDGKPKKKTKQILGWSTEDLGL